MRKTQSKSYCQPKILLAARLLGFTTFSRSGGGGYDDFDEEMNVNEANFLVSKVSKLSAGARTLV